MRKQIYQNCITKNIHSFLELNHTKANMFIVNISNMKSMGSSEIYTRYTVVS